MITNFNVKNRKDDIKILLVIVSIFLFCAWLCTPPGNKFAQIAFFGNNTQFFIDKLTKSSEDLNEWKYHRNSAIYLARMEQKRHSLREMDNAIKTIPNYVSDAQLSNLYAERAQLRLYWREYSGALDDFLRVKNPDITQKFKIAMLYKQNGNNKYALRYCNDIINIDAQAYYGYACLADVYSSAGKHDIAVKVYDLLISRSKNRARYHADRAFYKSLCGDISGAEADVKKAKELSPAIDITVSIIDDILRPKILDLPIM